MDREEEAPPPPPPPFEPKLATVAKWFRDRRLSYDKRIEDVLIEWGVEQLEDIKLVGKNDWEKLLQYPKIKWKRFEKAFDNLTADEFNELKSDSILIRDTGTDAKSNGSATGSGRNKEKSGGNNGQYNMTSFYPKIPKKKQKTGNGSSNGGVAGDDRSGGNASSVARSADGEDIVTIDDSDDDAMEEERMLPLDHAVPAIGAYDWRSHRVGVDGIADPPNDLERKNWDKSPITKLFTATTLAEKGVEHVLCGSLDDVSGLYRAFGASRTTSDEEMEELIKKEESRRRKELTKLHPDKGGDSDTFHKWSNDWDSEFGEAVKVLGNVEERCVHLYWIMMRLVMYFVLPF